MGGELSLGHLPGISWRATIGVRCHVLAAIGLYVFLKGQNNKKNLRKSHCILTRL